MTNSSAVPQPFSFTPYRAIFFDLDGTLVDSAPDIAASVDATLAECQWPQAGLARVRDWVGNGSQKLIERAIRYAQGDTADSNTVNPELQEQVHRKFLAQYAQHNGALSQLYPGVIAFLQHCQSLKLRMALITNKPHALAIQLTEALGISHFFELTLGGDSFPTRKPDPVALNFCMEQFGLSNGDCLMVGDSETDLNSARNANMRCLCVTYGYNRGRNIADANPDYLTDKLDQLITV